MPRLPTPDFGLLALAATDVVAVEQDAEEEEGEKRDEDADCDGDYERGAGDEKLVGSEFDALGVGADVLSGCSVRRGSSVLFISSLDNVGGAVDGIDDRQCLPYTIRGHVCDGMCTARPRSWREEYEKDVGKQAQKETSAEDVELTFLPNWCSTARRYIPARALRPICAVEA